MKVLNSIVLIFTLFVGSFAGANSPDLQSKLAGKYEFYFSFPNGPSFTDEFRIDSLTLADDSNTDYSVYTVVGAFISPKAFGEVPLQQAELRVSKDAGLDHIHAELHSQFHAERMDIEFVVKFGLSSVSKAVLIKEAFMNARFGKVLGKRVNKL